MGTRFANWIFHFDCCSTIAVERSRISDFLSETEVLMVMGDKIYIDWIESSAIDLLFSGYFPTKIYKRICQDGLRIGHV